MDEPRKRRMIAVSFDEEDAKDIDRLKQIRFYNKHYSDLYRYLIKLGLQKAKEEMN